VTIQRNNLKEQVVDIIRDNIITGAILPGTKLVEREVAENFNISRAPARDALMQLEKEGLIVTKRDARYVIELHVEDIRRLYDVRIVLEDLAVRLAAQNTSPQNQHELNKRLQEMASAVARQDTEAFIRSDVELHRLIWEQTQNRYLQNALSMMLGPIHMFTVNNAERFDWEETLHLHEDLVGTINSGDVEASVASLKRHMENSLGRVLRVFEADQPVKS
jgi:DNA-binding GntR family transcriptional regulator